MTANSYKCRYRFTEPSLSPSSIYDFFLLQLLVIFVDPRTLASESDGSRARGEGVPNADVSPPLNTQVGLGQVLILHLEHLHPQPPHPRLALPLRRPVPHLRQQDWIQPQ